MESPLCEPFLFLCPLGSVIWRIFLVKTAAYPSRTMVFPPSQKNLCQAQRDDKYFIIFLTLILLFLIRASFRMQFLFLWYERFAHFFALILQ